MGDDKLARCERCFLIHACYRTPVLTEVPNGDEWMNDFATSNKVYIETKLWCAGCLEAENERQVPM